MKILKVSAAVIVKDGKIFVSQRGYGEFKDGWEFPGGKIKPGETPDQTVVREIEEELDADIAVDKILGDVEYDYPDFHISMKFFKCHLLKPHLELLEHEAAKWVDISELKNIKLLGADKEIEKYLETNGVD